MTTNNTTEETIQDIKVIISVPEEETKGVTFLLPGSYSPVHRHPTVRDYGMIRKALNDKGQIVIGFETISVMLGAPTHEQYATKVAGIFQEYRARSDNNSTLPDKYNITGHSVGGTIALLAAVNDNEHVKTVISLDPIDRNPVQFTNNRGNDLTLENAGESIHLTYAESSTSFGIPLGRARSAFAIYEKNKEYVATFLSHPNAGHFYCTDTGTGPLIGGGTAEGNTTARDQILRLIVDKI